MLTLRRIDPARNMARFYSFTLSRSLFGDIILERRWGRIGTFGRRREQWFARTEDAERVVAELAAAKARRGYQAVRL